MSVRGGVGMLGIIAFPLAAEGILPGTVSGYVKAMYVHDDRKKPKLDQSTFGIGGKIAFETNPWGGLQAKAAYYLTTDLGTRSSDPRKTDAYMFDIDKTPYGVLGEAYVAYSGGNATLVFGRQEIDTPIISTYDYRIIPNLFEAYTLTNRDLPHTTLTLSYVTKMSGLDGLVSFKNFRSMSQQTYTSLSMDPDYAFPTNDGETVDVSKISGERGVLMGGIVYEGAWRFQGWNYYCPEVLNHVYADAAYPFSLSTDLAATLEIQGYGVRPLGAFKSFLGSLGLEGEYELYGARLSLEEKGRGITASAAFNVFTGDTKTVTAFGNWGGYPEYVSIPYMFAQDQGISALASSRMGKLALRFDLAKAGLAGQSLVVGYSMIDLDESVIHDSDIGVLNVVYKAILSGGTTLRAQYESRESHNYRYDNDILTLSATYPF